TGFAAKLNSNPWMLCGSKLIRIIAARCATSNPVWFVVAWGYRDFCLLTSVQSTRAAMRGSVSCVRFRSVYLCKRFRMPVTVEKKESVTTIILSRPAVRNAVDRQTAEQLADAFRQFEADQGA